MASTPRIAEKFAPAPSDAAEGSACRPPANGGARQHMTDDRNDRVWHDAASGKLSANNLPHVFSKDSCIWPAVAQTFAPSLLLTLQSCVPRRASLCRQLLSPAYRFLFPPPCEMQSKLRGARSVRQCAKWRTWIRLCVCVWLSRAGGCCGCEEKNSQNSSASQAEVYVPASCLITPSARARPRPSAGRGWSYGTASYCAACHR